ncbi:MAG: HAD family phosphatase [Candidatus Aminicenantes bacterium]|nr:MAG: HAD family phosphatase [Candidatus Aminicenantes bacterium]
MRRIRCVISDLGKVIIFFDNNIFFTKMADYCPFSKEEIRELTFTHMNLIETFDCGRITPVEFYNRVVRNLKARIDHDTFYSIYNDVFSPNPPVLKIMEKLKRNYRLVLFSNTDIMRYSFIKEKFPGIQIFDEYVLSYEVGFMKPHPQIYLEALKKARAKAEDCVFIDDREENIEVAVRLGINVIHFMPQTDLESDLREMGLSF